MSDTRKLQNPLDVRMGEGNSYIEHCTIRDYLKGLLVTLWSEGEDFSGKRPFGNSDWQWEIYEAFVMSGHLEGEIDEDGYIDPGSIDEREAHQFVLDFIRYHTIITN